MKGVTPMQVMMGLVEVALARWGLAGDIKKLPGEHDDNFHVQSNGKQYLLKISRADESLAVIELQTVVLQALAENTQSFQTPVPQQSKAGKYIETIQTQTGVDRYARLFSYVSGQLLGEIPLHTDALCESLGAQVGSLSLVLAAIKHPEAARYLKWDLQHADWIKDHLSVLTADEKTIIQKYLNVYLNETQAQFKTLRQAIIHGDLNDYNILASKKSVGNYLISGFIDFGDLVQTAQINELVIALTYVMFNKPDPLATAALVIKSYHQIYPLEEREVACIFNLICMRLCVSLVNSAIRKKENPNDPYLTISEKPAWELLGKLDLIHPRFALAVFRDACGWAPVAESVAIKQWLSENANQFHPLFQFAQSQFTPYAFDLSPGSLQVEQFELIAERLAKENIPLAIGRYNEARLIYSNDQYYIPGNAGPEARTIHIGMDFFVPAGKEIHAPLDGIVHSFADNAIAQDYGPTIVLEHSIAATNIKFYTLYGHLCRESLTQLSIGKVIKKGEVVGSIGEQAVNGGWLPHLHFQLMTDMLDMHGTFPGVARASQRAVWLSLCLDPNLLVGLPPAILEDHALSQAAIAELRQQLMSKNVGVSYQSPLHFVRGIGQYLYDENGRRYLDCVNNVCHVGHCEPRVVKASHEQMALLNTNTRYYHENLVRYAEKLIATFPKPLTVCFFVNSGSEANELALRLARNYTKRKNIVVMDNGYHGNTSTLIDISAYKFNGKGGSGKPEFVTVIPMPDQLRQQHLEFKNPGFDNTIAAFISESLLSCGGQIELPAGYLQSVYAAIRQAGGVCIADEVQVGFGRVGTHYWGFATQDVVPDIVTLGKPMGNGHPIGAVVTTREIADAFCNGMEFFSTFGGNPVSCAIGLSVMDVIEQDQLQANALAVGNYLLSRLNDLKNQFEVIGDVRGRGLFIGIEMVTDKKTNTPAPELASALVNHMKQHGVLLSTDGPYHNVVKIKPPMVFTSADVDYLITQLQTILALLSI